MFKESSRKPRILTSAALLGRRAPVGLSGLLAVRVEERMGMVFRGLFPVCIAQLATVRNSGRTGSEVSQLQLLCFIIALNVPRTFHAVRLMT